MAKKRQYIDLLKEAINGTNDGDTTDTVDLKGPFVDGIVSYKGGGELPTHKDASGILERYYFNEENDEGITIEEDTPPAESNEIDEVPDKNIQKTKKDIEKAVQEQEDTPKKAMENLEDEEEEEAVKEDIETEDTDVVKEDQKNVKEDQELTEAEEAENAIVEKLVAEMEEEGDEGAGTKAAGTGDAEKAIPDRKDAGEGDGVTDKPVKKLKEQDETDEEEIDVDKELEKGEEEEEEVEEAFKLFSEQIEDLDDVEDDSSKAIKIDSDEIQV